MSTNSMHSLHHHHLAAGGHHQQPPHPSPAFFLKPSPTALKLSVSSSSTTTTTTTTYSLSPTSPPSITFAASASAAAAASTSEPATTLDTLSGYLAAKDYRQADEETRRLLIALVGEAAVKRGYVFFSEVKFISEADLKAIDTLWKEHSGGKFGYSVQKRIWEKNNKDFSRFFIKVGWMKKLDTEVEQYNYRSFPAEFIWELSDETPEGHLPLTNALRGTQLLNCILSHPAFEDTGEAASASEASEDSGDSSKPVGQKPLSKRLFKPNYSF
ncbi:hypothetical protein SAY87_003750 [Trapa incisa]|uniref:GUN4-like domain-containing protein n=2 Tax=Trapa TaxID=22665 RepID=A0AAN7QU07_TRANT|nr:hypothetical protein SAY87_003750 [Trapa incisa]KAK4778562.1 hypothetical protein SAY86_006090 [Trapa natans]